MSALARRDPHGAHPLATVERHTDLALCRQFIRHHSKSFYLSSLLLPRAERHESWALYAFCRQADDTVDGENPGDGSLPALTAADQDARVLLARVAGLRRRLERLYAGDPGHGPERAIDRSFLRVVERTGLPRAVPDRLLVGMEMDARGDHYRSWDDLYGYCFNVASTVGLMMTYVMGHRMPAARVPEVFLRASDLGLAMQLTNIARDVGEDGRRGRVYLPDELLAAHELDERRVLAECQSGRPASPALCAATRELVERAAAHYQAASLGIPMLAPASRLAIRSAQLIYSAIGARLRRQGAHGYDPLVGRAHLGLWGKLGRIAVAAVQGLGSSANRIPEAPTQGPRDALLLTLCREVGVVDAAG